MCVCVLCVLVTQSCLTLCDPMDCSAWTWCSGKTWRERVGREGGGGIGMGNTCKSMADSYQCMAKITTILYSN